MIAGSHPILSCAGAAAFEAELFGGDEAIEWLAMERAGHAVAAAVLSDFEEIGGFPEGGRLLVLAGKGHNGGDALIAAGRLLACFPRASADVVFAFGDRALRPLAGRAWKALAGSFGARVRTARASDLGPVYDLCLDGVFGFQFRPPLDDRTADLLDRVNALAVRFRAAVDLPSGDVFRADFTYATGSVKAPVMSSERAGRVRYLDLGFFRGRAVPGGDRVLTREVLAPLQGFRSPRTDKRTFGHLFVIGGSRSYPGAVLMAVLAALRSGAGLVTGFVPESLVPAFAAQVPEAIWVGWPETPEGGLALEGEYLLRERIARATALVIGPGLGREAESLALVANVVKTVRTPVLLDADALQPDIVRGAEAPLVLTPHAGEFERIAGGQEVRRFAEETGAIVVLKGPVTRIVGPSEAPGTNAVVYHSLFGGPVLARGGSGDVLAGLVGGLIAQAPGELLPAAARGVVWHGLAADLLARAQGQVAARTTELINRLPAVLRERL
ncbi:MAG TPA: NAD(P)H-hydrate dehydratase [Opitutus sp.]|nr:NAD(P)H-hydrate dehydratase [Opitutus sp.]